MDDKKFVTSARYTFGPRGDAHTFLKVMMVIVKRYPSTSIEVSSEGITVYFSSVTDPSLFEHVDWLARHVCQAPSASVMRADL